MHHWTVHGKVDFPKFPGGSIQQLLILNSEMNLKNFFQSWGDPFHSTAFDPELRNEFKKFSNPEVVHSTTFHLELRNERFTLISFMEFPTILSTLQPFQICTLNRK